MYENLTLLSQQGPTVSPNKVAMSRALGAAFLNHQVEQLEKSVSGTTGPASGNWRRRQSPPGGAPVVNGNTKRPPMAPGIKVASRRPGEESQAARKARAPGGRDPGAGIIRIRSQDTRRKSKDEDRAKEDRRDDKDADIVVVDASVLIHALYQLKRWCREGRDEIIIVPLEALNTLDLLKKGTSPLAQRARAASRILEAQVGTNARIRVQQDDAFVLWDKIEFDEATPSANSNTSPEWVRRTICCAQWEVDAASKNADGPPKKVILAVLGPSSDIATSMNDLKLSSSPATPVPLPAPHVHANKHEPRSSGTLVTQWAARAHLDMITVDPTAAPADDETGARPKRGPRPSRPSDGGATKGHHGHGHGQGALVERPPAVMAMMEMVAQPSKVVRVLARGEKLDPDP
ncbi:hypothetical protein C0991_003776 [Blastosporella zonata]|nr:hypothetical protein C0991_003776 [Blastosporella zonata]